MSTIIAGTFCQIYTRYLGSDKTLSVLFQYCEQWSDNRFHLEALCIDFLLKILCVINSAFKVSLFLVDSENNNTTVILVGETGQCVIQTFRAAHSGAF